MPLTTAASTARLLAIGFGLADLNDVEHANALRQSQ